MTNATHPLDPALDTAHRPNGGHEAEHYHTIVIGGGQAGLSVGYHLARRGLHFLILEAKDRVGDSWRERWDSLRLFTPARFDGLDGMPFPAHGDTFPRKDDMADYLEAYVRRFELPVRTGVRVDRLSREDGRFIINAGPDRFEADNVVVAMSDFQKPRVPAFAEELDPRIVQLHSSDYRNPDQLQDGPVLIVGAGNSGSEIAMDLAPRHRIWLSGRDTGALIFRPRGLLGRLILVRLVLRVLFHRVLTVATPLGRKARPRVTSQGGPLIRVKPRDLRRAGVVRVPRTAGTRDGLPVLDDGRMMDVANVIWCTGFRPGFGWIDLPVFERENRHDGARGRQDAHSGGDRARSLHNDVPTHRSGIVDSEPGLYFVGLHFLHALSSVMIHGVGRDADRVAGAIAAGAGVAGAA